MGRVYAGATAGAQPIVIKLDRRRTTVSDLVFSCIATDTTPPGMFWSASERLGNFPLVGGRFGDTWSDTEAYSDGSTETYEWNIAGRVTATSAKGTIALSSTLTKSTGETMGFRMPATKFTAASG